MSKAELLGRLDEAVAQARATLAKVAPDQLGRPCRIQGFDETVLSAVADSVSHFGGHTQEIVYATRLQLGGAYKFEWTPTTPEQGA